VWKVQEDLNFFRQCWPSWRAFPWTSSPNLSRLRSWWGSWWQDGTCEKFKKIWICCRQCWPSWRTLFWTSSRGCSRQIGWPWSWWREESEKSWGGGLTTGWRSSNPLACMPQFVWKQLKKQKHLKPWIQKQNIFTKPTV